MKMVLLILVGSLLVGVRAPRIDVRVHAVLFFLILLSLLMAYATF